MDQNEIDALVDDIRDGVICSLDTYGWQKGAYGSDGQGYCLIGAVRKATGSDPQLERVFQESARQTAADLFPGSPGGSVENFNDFQHTSEEDARLLVKHSFEKMKDLLNNIINGEPAADGA
jgi:hypothetical protein